jgi:hypothetical protein
MIFYVLDNLNIHKNNKIFLYIKLDRNLLITQIIKKVKISNYANT